MGRIKDYPVGSLTGSQIVANSSDDETILIDSSDFQAADTDLTAIAALVSAANKLPYATGSGTWALADFSAYGRSLVDDADASAARTTLGVVIGTDVQAFDTDLAAIAALVSAANKLPYATGSGTWALADFTVFGRSLVDDADASAARTTLGVVIGTDVQAQDSDLSAIAGLSPSNDDFIQRKAGAWTNRTPTQVTADLIAFVGDSGSGGTKGLVPAPATGDAAASKFLKADGTWASPSGSGDVTGPASSTNSAVAGFSGTDGKTLKQLSASEIRAAASLATSDSPQFTGIELGHATDTTLTRTAAGAIAVEGLAVAMAGKQMVPIPAGAMKATTTNGAASGTVEMTTNKNMFVTLDFDTSTQEFAQFSIPMPKSWNESTVTFQAVWSHAATTTNFGVVWQLAGVAVSDDDAGDVAFGTAQTSTDTGGTTNDIYISPESSAITIAGSPAENDFVMFQVARVPANGSDTMAIDARLHAIKLFITTNAGNDA